MPGATPPINAHRASQTTHTFFSSLLSLALSLDSLGLFFWCHCLLPVGEALFPPCRDSVSTFLRVPVNTIMHAYGRPPATTTKVGASPPTIHTCFPFLFFPPCNLSTGAFPPGPTPSLLQILDHKTHRTSTVNILPLFPNRFFPNRKDPLPVFLSPL